MSGVSADFSLSSPGTAEALRDGRRLSSEVGTRRWLLKQVTPVHVRFPILTMFDQVFAIFDLVVFCSFCRTKPAGLETVLQFRRTPCSFRAGKIVLSRKPFYFGDVAMWQCV